MAEKTRRSPRAQQIIDWLRARNIDPALGAEIGVLKGDTSRQLLEEFPSLHLLMVDSWAVPQPHSAYVKTGDQASRQTQAQHDENKRLAYEVTDFADSRRSVFELPSVEATWHLPEAYLDFVFIDGDHSYEGVKEDLAAWWPKLKPGGVFCGHDYWMRGRKGARKSVTLAVDEFAAVLGKKVILGDHATWCLGG